MSPKQTLITMQVDVSFLRHIDSNLRALGYSTRAGFIRDAIVQKMKLEGVVTEDEMALAPSRAGKGGTKLARKTNPTHRPSGAELNDAPLYDGKGKLSSKQAAELRQLQAAVARAAELPDPKSRPLPATGESIARKSARHNGTGRHSKSRP